MNIDARRAEPQCLSAQSRTRPRAALWRAGGADLHGDRLQQGGSQEKARAAYQIEQRRGGELAVDRRAIGLRDHGSRKALALKRGVDPAG